MFTIETLAGTPYEMGRQHGRIFRHLIEANVHTWAMRHTFQGTDEELDSALAEYRRSDETFAPWIAEELRGVADGSAVDYAWILRMHLRVWNVVPCREWAGSGCTGMGMITEDHGVVVGGTLDDPRASYVLVRRIPAEGIPHLSVAWVGSAWGHNAINEAGLCYAHMSLSGFQPALPLPKGTYASAGAATRLIIQSCRTVAEAAALLRRLRPTTSLILGDAGGDLLAFQGIGPFQAFEAPQDGMTFLTNHACLQNLVDAAARAGGTPIVTDRSQARYNVLDCARRNPVRTLARVRDLLQFHDGYPHSICNDRTVMASLAVPQKLPGKFQVADRPPCRNPFVTYPVLA